MKVYVHLEDAVLSLSYTIAQVVGEETTAADFLTEFARVFNATNQAAILHVSALTLKDSDGRVLAGTRKQIVDLVSAGDDMFVSVEHSILAVCEALVIQKSDGEEHSSELPAEVRTESPSELQGDDDAGYEDMEPALSPSKPSKAKAKSKAKARAKAKVTQKLTVSDEQRANLKSLIVEKSFKKARELAEHILSAVDGNDGQTLLSLAEVLLKSRKYQHAQQICQRGLQVLPKSLQLHTMLIKTLMALKQYNEAKTYVLAALVIQSRPPSAGCDEPPALFEEAFRMELIALHAECVFELGNHNDAVAIINQTTANPASATSVPILLAYSSFAMRYNKLEEPTRALLKAVILGEHPRVREMLAKLMSSEAGIAEIMRQVPPSKAKEADRKGKCEVFAFLGYVAKCHSVIPASIRFYQIALDMIPASAGCALNLVHMYEIAADYEGAIRAVESFCRENPTLGLGLAYPSAATLQCSEMLSLLSRDESAGSRGELAQTSFSWVQLEDTYGYVRFTSVASTEPGSEEESTQPARKPSPLLSTKYHYTDAELDLLALFSTAVKVLFLQGKLHLLPALYQRIEPCRVQSERALHLTTIRNEMAYVQEIAQLLCYRYANASYGIRELAPSSSYSYFCNMNPVLAKPALSSGASSSVADQSPLLREASVKPIYVLGDSHCVSPAWSIIRVHGKPRLLVPRLATGVKHWHLRTDSTFYPKSHFRNMVASIPIGSDVSDTRIALCFCLS